VRSLKIGWLIPLSFACKDEILPVQCPATTANVDGICRPTCSTENDCLYSESCINGVCLPKSASEAPEVRLFRPDRLAVTPEDPTVRFDYVVTNASSVEMTPIPGALTEHAGTLEVALQETTTFTMVGRAQMGEDSESQTVQLVDQPPPGELAVTVEVVRYDPTPCESVLVQWTVVGEFDPSSLSLRIEADGNVVHTDVAPNGFAAIDLAGPSTLVVHAEADGAAGESAATAARPSMLCSVRALPEGPVSAGDSVLLEWETKGAALVFVDEIGTRGRLYTHPVLVRDEKRLGRWIVVPDPGRTRYRIIAQAANQGETEEMVVEIDAEGDRPPPIIDTFDVAPDWFFSPAPIDILWETRGAQEITLELNGEERILEMESGTDSFVISASAELFLLAERNGQVTSARRLVQQTEYESEPNDTPDSANPLTITNGQPNQSLARYGEFALAGPVSDIDWYSVDSSSALRVTIHDPLQSKCADLFGSRLTIQSEGDILYDAIIADGCPTAFLNEGRARSYLIGLASPENGGLLGASYVIAADTAPVTCGDRTIEWNEQCDDGNQIEGDGCSPACALERGYAYVLETAPVAPPEIPNDAQILSFLPYRIGMDEPRDEGFAIVPAQIDFFGSRYAGIMIHVNGYLSLVPNLAVGEPSLGSALLPNAVVAGFATDLRLESSGMVRYWTELEEGVVHVVQYDGVLGQDEHGNTIGPITFRIALSETGEVRLYYDPENLIPEGYEWIGGIEDGLGVYAFPNKACGSTCIGSAGAAATQFIP
jgi:cysteine-rich repeat protein